MTGDWETSVSPVSSFRAKREIFAIRGEEHMLSLYVPRTSPISSSVFLTASALSAPTGQLPLEGKADSTGIALSHKAFGHRPINKPPRIASYLRRVMTKHCMKIHAKSVSAIESAFP